MSTPPPTHHHSTWAEVVGRSLVRMADYEKGGGCRYPGIKATAQLYISLIGDPVEVLGASSSESVLSR